MKKIVLILILTLPVMTFGQPATVIATESYMAIKGGIYEPTGDLEEFDRTAYGEIAIGHNFTPNFGLEVGFGGFETEYAESGYDYRTGNWNGTIETQAKAIMITARGIIPIDKLSLYAGAGAGIYFVEGDLTFTSEAGNLSFSDDDRIPGIHVMAGVEYNLTPEIFAGIEAKYTMTEDAEFKLTAYGETLTVETDFNGYNVAAKVGFRF